MDPPRRTRRRKPMKKLTVKFLLAFGAILGASPLYAAPVTVVPAATATQLKSDEAMGEVKFVTVANPSFLKIEGLGSAPKGNLTASNNKINGTFTFTLDTLKTGMKKRDEHMRNYLKVADHPESKLEIKDVTVLPTFLSAPEKQGKIPFKGSLTLNGQTKEISGTFEGKKEGQGIKVSSDFSLQLTQFGIEIPEFAGLTVADKVDLSVQTLLVPGT